MAISNVQSVLSVCVCVCVCVCVWVCSVWVCVGMGVQCAYGCVGVGMCGGEGRGQKYEDKIQSRMVRIICAYKPLEV